jgi:hypothetical protein
MKASLSIFAIVLCAAALRCARGGLSEGNQGSSDNRRDSTRLTAGNDEADHILAWITFLSGPPDEKASLVYDNWKKRDGLVYAVWNFQPDSTHRIWLSCRYANTDVVLIKELPSRFLSAT